MTVQLTKRRFTVSEYHQMAHVGILTEDDRVELIDGEIVVMTPIGHRHAASVNRCNRLLSRCVEDAAVVSIQNPVRLDEHNEPQPDVALLRPRPDFYASGHPTPADVLLIIEVADTSVEADRQVKLPLYARGGIPEAWLVDLQLDVITIYRDPTPDGYRTSWTVGRGEWIAPLAFPKCTIAVTDILG